MVNTVRVSTRGTDAYHGVKVAQGHLINEDRNKGRLLKWCSKGTEKLLLEKRRCTVEFLLYWKHKKCFAESIIYVAFAPFLRWPTELFWTHTLHSGIRKYTWKIKIFIGSSNIVNRSIKFRGIKSVYEAKNTSMQIHKISHTLRHMYGLPRTFNLWRCNH
jgi:hypothetical protein